MSSLFKLMKKGGVIVVQKKEFLAKLHYLRSGFHQGKISMDAFDELEKKIVVSFWNKGS